MAIFDIIIAVILIFGFIRGLMKGLFVEVASLLALIAGVYGAIHFSYYIGDFLKSKVSWEEQYISLVAFAATFAIIVLIVSLLGRILTKVANFAFLGWLNKILGGVFAALKYALIISIVLLLFDRFNNTIPFIDQEAKNSSILYEPVRKLAPTLFPSIINDYVKPVEKQENTV